MASSRKPRSAELAAYPLDARVARELARQVRPGETVTVALSGGVDSVVLLDTLRRAAPLVGVRLRALHVNHGLSRNAAKWEQFCARHCKRRGIEFEAMSVRVGGDGTNVEAEARRARYQAFSERGSEVVALAHNLDDQAETVLLHLLRGSGVRGLAGMPPARFVTDARTGDRRQRLIRPLLQATRREILAHATRRRLQWIDDESNRQERFARNYLRLRVLPLLERRFADCRTRLARAAAHLQEAAGLLEEIGALDCAAVSENGRVHAGRLEALGAARAANALRVFLANRGEGPLSSARMAELLRQLTRSRADARPEVELPVGILNRYRGWIGWRPRPGARALIEPHVWRGESVVPLGVAGILTAVRTQGDGVSAARLAQAEVTVRWRRGGERVRPHAKRPTRTLKNLLQEAGVPPWQRRRMPLLFCGEQLVWAPAVGVAVEFQARPGEPAWRFGWEASRDSDAGP